MKKYVTMRIGKEFASFLLDKKAVRTVSLLFVAAFVVFIGSASIGEMKISPLAVLRTLFGMGEETDRLIVMSFRMPRIVTALLVGVSLAVAGSILQGLIRNPLASPEILGITGGAGVAVVLFLALFSDRAGTLSMSVHWLPVGAFIGATVTACLVYLFSWKHGEVQPFRLILVGIGIAALTKALTILLMILSPIHQVGQANVWLTGTVYGASWNNVMILAPWTCILVGITYILARKLNVQGLGDELAIGLGSAVQRHRLILLLLCTALIGGAVAFAGGIGFVGLMAPHIARRLVGSSFGALLPVSACVGAILVMAADFIGRVAFAPLEIPAGIFTATIGAPYFIYLLYKSRST